jgi:uncharacterized protein YecE (DUF72 family)
MIRTRIGTAGWTIPRAAAAAFPAEGSGLRRYAGVFSAVEINSTFRRSHRASTYEGWAAAVPASFRFAVKTPKALTHEARLVGCEAGVEAFVDEVARLGDKLGPILLQLPPSLGFDPAVVDPFCRRLSRDQRFPVVCEPRHATWFTSDVEAWLAERHIARVAADPARHPGAGEPGGWRGLSYYRQHGSPRVYYSAYGPEGIARLRAQLGRDPAPDIWCIFDNTASGAAAADALALQAALASPG